MDKYAKVGRLFGTVLTAAILIPFGIIFLFLVFGGALSNLVGQNPSPVDNLKVIGGFTLIFLCVAIVVLGFVLVPILFAVALIHVAVDVGRSLRAIRQSLSEKD